MGVQAVAAIAQATGGAQLAVLVLVVGSGRSTDAYVTLFSASQLAGSIVVIGTLQQIALSTPNYDKWRQWTLFGSGLNIVAVLGTGVLLGALNYPARDVVMIAIVIAVSGTLAVISGVLAVERALRGDPFLLCGLTIVPNLVATLLVVVATGHDKVLWMCIGLLIGNVAVTGYAWRNRPAPPDSKQDEFAEPPPSRRDVAGVMGASSVGALGPFGFQAAIASFPPGQATILGFFSRVGAGVIGVGVTAFNYSTTDWERRSVSPLRRLSGISTKIFIGSMVAAAGFAAWSGHDDWVAGALAFAWISCAASSVTASRALGMAGNYRPFHQMAIISLVLYPLLTWALVAGPHNATSYFAALLAIIWTGNVINLRAIGWRSELSGAFVAAAIAIVVAGFSLV